MKGFLEKFIWSLFKRYHIHYIPKVEAAELGKGAEGAREPPSSPFLQHGVADYILDWTSLSIPHSLGNHILDCTIITYNKPQ